MFETNFKTKEQERDFKRVLILMDTFYVFSTGRHSNLAIQTTILYIVYYSIYSIYGILLRYNTKVCLRIFNEHTQVHDVKEPRRSPFNPKFLLFKLNAPCYVVTWVVISISNLRSESVSDREIVPPFC